MKKVFKESHVPRLSWEDLEKIKDTPKQYIKSEGYEICFKEHEGVLYVLSMIEVQD